MGCMDDMSEMVFWISASDCVCHLVERILENTGGGRLDIPSNSRGEGPAAVGVGKPTASYAAVRGGVAIWTGVTLSRCEGGIDTENEGR